MKKTGIINKIIAFSNVDGPGNRTAVFFQGCNLHCLFCHNPETIHTCVGCGMCAEKCPKGALESAGAVVGRPDGAGMGPDGAAAEPVPPVLWDPSRCVDCDTCIKTCPHLASPKVQYMTAEALRDKIRRTAPYINGVSFSGGECTQQRDFLVEVIPLIRELGLGVLLDSNGTYDFEQDPELLAMSDGVMLDIKAADLDFCRLLTGAGPELPFHNLDFLQRAGKLEEVRTVLFPHHPEQNEATVRAAASRLRPDIRYKLLRYRPFGVRQEGLDFLGGDITPESESARLAEIARSLGAENIVPV
nr:YjjW family glycine radical enzyme activase [Lachnospiraceae bacterium]